MSKYKLLWEYMKKNNKDSYDFTFKEIEDILGFPLDHSFLTYKKEVQEYGYIAEKIYLKEKRISFKKL